MNPRIRSVLTVIGLLTLIAIGIIVIPRGLSLYYQTKGGQHVEYVLRFEEGIDELVCEPLPSDDGGALREVEQGVVDLNRAIKFNDNNAQAYYYLGKAYCLIGNLNQAKENYFRYTQLRSSNPLGFMGLGFTYEKLGDKISAKSAWKSADLVPEDFYNIGDRAFNYGEYDDAIRWYERAAVINGEISAPRQFRWGVASVQTGQQIPSFLDTDVFPTNTLTEDLQISGSELHWMRQQDEAQEIYHGKRLSEFPAGDPNIGGMWWDGPAVAIVQVPCNANYSIQARVVHLSPAGLIGQLQIENNLVPVAMFTLSDEWQDYDVEVDLTEGYHLLGVRYLEDAGDVMIEWLRVNQKTDCES